MDNNTVQDRQNTLLYQNVGMAVAYAARAHSACSLTISKTGHIGRFSVSAGPGVRVHPVTYIINVAREVSLKMFRSPSMDEQDACIDVDLKNSVTDFPGSDDLADEKREVAIGEAFRILKTNWKLVEKLVGVCRDYSKIKRDTTYLVTPAMVESRRD